MRYLLAETMNLWTWLRYCEMNLGANHQHLSYCSVFAHACFSPGVKVRELLFLE